MKKVSMLLVAVIIACGTVLAGCAKDGAGGKVTLTWWSMDTPAWVQANDKLIEDYKKVNPDVKINYQKFPYDVLVQKLKAVYASKKPPDIVQMFGTWVTEYAQKGVLASTADTSFVGDFYPAPMGAFEYDGQLYGIPHEFNIEYGGALARPDLFQEAGVAYPPATWDDLVNGAKKMTKWDGNNIKTRGFDLTSNDSLNFYLLAMILQQGGNYWTEDNNHVNFTSPEAINAMTNLKELITVHKVSSLLGADDEPHMMFFKGGSAATVAGPWTISEGAEYDLKFDYMPLPPFAGTPRFVAESGWGEVVSKASKHQEEAWDFIKFAAQPENARPWNLTTQTVPAIKTIAEDPSFLAEAPLLKPSLDVLPYGEWIGPVRDRDFWFEKTREIFELIVREDMTVEDGLKKIEDEINAMLDRQ